MPEIYAPIGRVVRTFNSNFPVLLAEEKIIYPSKELIIQLNKSMVAISNDPFVLQNEANLEHIVEAVKFKFERKSFYDKMILKASYLLEMLACKAHAFAEGNKRTALSVTIAFLEANNVLFQEENQEELSRFILDVASGKLNAKKISKWLQKRTQNERLYGVEIK